jgi:hypothetical protein
MITENLPLEETGRKFQESIENEDLVDDQTWQNVKPAVKTGFTWPAVPYLHEVSPLG